MWEGVYHAAPASHAWHGYLDNVLAELLGPYARRAGLVGTGPFNLGEADDYRVGTTAAELAGQVQWPGAGPDDHHDGAA